MPIYRLNTKIRLTVLRLSGFELYSRWVPLNNALHRTTSNGVRDCGRGIALSRRKTHSIILWSILSVA